MGIPKFYRWLSERYPLLNMPVTATEAPPEIDNLYLDMNGIIHNCTHANDPNLKLTETEMVLRIFNYLDKLIQIMKPKKLVFLAIDGVAPRAKMNQQRSRRFKSALERLAHEAEQKAKGDETPDEYKFDSNCITPGTAFMARLGKHLRFFIRKKISEDTTWQQPVVIFSGHDVPGEGEHKIMEYIRWQKRSPQYTPNQRHCMYGLDADLIMLSLVTHEPHFCLLREVVSFGGKNRGQPARETLENPSAENFILFQIGLLREYIELEFTAHMAGKQLSFALDVERVVDDIVLFCMLVGNDFLPALPTLDIAEGALNKLIELYKQLLPQMGGYLTYAGDLNHERLQLLLGVLADAELQTLEERAADTEWFESKRSKRGGRGGRGGGPSHSSSRPQTASAAIIGNTYEQQAGYGSLGDLGDLEDLSAAAVAFRSQEPVVAPLAAVVPALQGLELEPDEPETGPTMMSKEARAMFLNGGGEEALQAWKERYYKEKLEVRDASPESTREVVHHYIRGLHWVLQYYYRGVASWDWFYPYHYAPMASDMRDLDGIIVRFNRGKPFKPFEQLLAVLPAASASLLPHPFQWLMTDARSPVLDFYPDKFDIDMEGKRAEWEGIVKVPFIDEQRLLAAAASVPLGSLTAEERKRNVPGDMLVYEYASGRHEPEHCDTTLPHHFGSIAHAHSMCRRVPPPDPIPVADRGFVPVLAKGTSTGKKNPPGFPTLKTMSNLVVELKMAGVNVFANPSKKDSLVLQLPDVRSTIAADAAAPLLRGMLCGRVYVKWPYLQEAEIVGVSDARQRISVEGISQHTPEAASKWQMVAGQTKNMFLTKSGIDIGPLPIVLDVRVCTGYVRGADGPIKKEYAKELAPYPLQAVLQSRPKPPAGFADPDAPKQLSLQPGSKVIWVGANHFGCLGTVLADPAAKVAGKASTAGYVVRVQPLHRELLQAEGRARHIVQQYSLEFYPSGLACRQLRVNPRMLGRLTGNVWVDDSKGDRVDVGLAVKNAKQGLCVPSLCRPAPEGTGWSYSTQMIELVREYKARFPSVLAALEPSAADGSLEGGDQRQKLTAAALFPGAPPELLDQKLAEVRTWLKSLPSSKRPLVAMTSQTASDAAVDRLQLAIPGLLPVGAAGVGPVELEQVHPSLLLPPHDPACPISVLAGGACEPGDRVVVLRGTGAPPFGARGTVIGVLGDSVEVLMDEEYAGGSTLGGRLRGARGAYLPPEQLLNVSKQHPVKGTGPKPRPAAVNSRRSSHDAAAAAAAKVTSPRTAAAASATRLVALAPWVKGKQLQQHAAAQGQQQQHDGVPAVASGPSLAATGAAPVAPTTQGNRLLQLLKKNQPQVTGPGGAAAAAATVPAPAVDQQQQQHVQQAQAAAVPQQEPQAIRSGSLKAALQAAAVKAQQQQQQQQQAPVPGAAPSAPDTTTGRSLLLRLQKSSSGGKVPPAAEARQQAGLQPVQQQQPQLSVEPIVAVPRAAAPVSHGPTQQQQVAQLPGSAGASLLAMLQKPPPGKGAKQPPAAAAAPAAVERMPAAEASAAQPQQQQRQQGSKQLQVKIVPRPKKTQQQQQPQEQQQPAQPQPAPITPERPQQQQQQQEQVSPMPVTPPAQAPKQQQQQQPASTPVDVPEPKPGLIKARAANVSDETGVKPRTPPAGAGANLLANRGQTVIQARLPDGTRGFTMGRGQRVSAGSGPSAAPAAPGSSNSSTSSNGGVGSLAAAATAATVSPFRASAAPGTVVNGFAEPAGGAAPVAQPVAADGLSSRSSGALGSIGGAAADGGGAGQALMKLLQRGASTDIGSSPQQQQQQPAPLHQQQQPASIPVPHPVAGVVAPAADTVAAVNTSAASNLLRRLQQQQSAHKQ